MAIVQYIPILISLIKLLTLIGTLIMDGRGKGRHIQLASKRHRHRRRRWSRPECPA